MIFWLLLFFDLIKFSRPYGIRDSVNDHEL